MKFKGAFIALALLALPLGGCDTIASFTAGLATSLSSSSPSQATTLSQAIQAADLATQAATVAVNTGKLDAGTLHEIDALSDGIHSGLTKLEADNAAGKSLNYSAFNAALDAFNSYMTTKGLSH